MRVLNVLLALFVAAPAFANVDRNHETLDLFRHYLQTQETAETLVMRTFTHLASFDDDVQTIAKETNRLAQQSLLTEDQEEKIRFLQKLYNQTVWEHNRLAESVHSRNMAAHTALNLLMTAPITAVASKVGKFSRRGTILTGALLALMAVATGPINGILYDFVVNERYTKPVSFADNLTALRVHRSRQL